MTRRWGRRELLRAGGTIGAAALAGCSGLLGGAGAVSGDSWPSFQRGPANGGANPAASGPGEDLNRRWETTAESLVAELAEESMAARVSPPAVVDGSVYAAVTAVNLDMGLHLVALDPEDGSLQWSTKAAERYGQPGTGPLRPTIVDGTVVVPNPGVAPSSVVAAVDVESQEVTWREDGDRLTATSGTARDGQVVFGESTAWALSTDGSFAWEFTEGSPAYRARLNQPATVTADGPYVPTGSHLFALDQDGEKRWERDLAFEIEPFGIGTRPYTPAAGDAIYVATGALEDRSDGRLLALDPGDGSTRWEFKPEFDPERREQRVREIYDETGRTFPLGVGIYSTPALSGGTLYALGWTMPESDDARQSTPELFAIDAGSGEPQWTTELPASFGLTPPVVAGGTVYVPTEAGLVAVDAGSGDLLTTGAATDGFTDGLAVVGDTVYASDVASIVAIGP